MAKRTGGSTASKGGKRGVGERARKLARGEMKPPQAARSRRGIPLVGHLDSPGAPGSGIAGAGAVEDEARKDRRK